MAVRAALRQVISDWSLPRAAKLMKSRDLQGLPGEDPGSDAVVKACLGWLKRAQDFSASHDGGFARDFSLVSGWATSYPETSGYIVPTFIAESERGADSDLSARARRCLDWLVAIQFPDGGFQGGKIDQEPRVPVTFNTGQILLGLAAGAASLDRDKYLEPMRRAAIWLRDSQDTDGCWRKHPTPFSALGDKAYETHVAWGLFEAARVLPGEGFGEAGMKQVRWALTKQQANGWFAANCLEDPDAPLAHTIGYVLRGVVEAHLWSKDAAFVEAACRTADGLLPSIAADGRLPGRLDSNWRGAVDWVCLTGSAQIAHSLFILARLTRRLDYAEKAKVLNAYIRRTIALTGDADTIGGVKGSFPVQGEYGRFQYLNWAAKFLIDSCREELSFAASGLQSTQ
ncbi:MAG: hypothetical protein K8S25_13880 [Alphaproteobacteria bacterium]|nr:hypothetical protein [Alphaproteobacteria bacterium]